MPNGDRAMGRRQCTREFKIEPLTKKYRELVGLASRQRAKGILCETFIGISTDEALRMKPSREPWNVHRWPLIEKGMARHDCLNWMERKGYPMPPKSSCIGCPYHSDHEWRAIKADPEAWADALEIDRIIREPARETRGRQFMHRSCVWHELCEKKQSLNVDFKFHDLAGKRATTPAGQGFPRTESWDHQSLRKSDSRREGIVMASHFRMMPVPLRKKLAALHLAGSRVYTAESFAETVFGKVLLRDVDEEWVLDRELNLTQSASYGRLKEILDRGMALVLLLFFLPVILVTALAILLLDGQPVFYRQKRKGLRDEVFEVVKFRTMKNREEAGSDYTGEKDERITLLGRILRPSRIDELPQLWNVLVGEMSLIGPRAEWVKLADIS